MEKKVSEKKFFFGWENIKWFLRELLNVYSGKRSYLSKKRIESGIGFLIAEWGMIFFLIKKYDVMSTTDFAIWASIQFCVAGYIVSQIQKEKSDVLEKEERVVEVVEEVVEEVEPKADSRSGNCC